MDPICKITVLISGSGTNLQALIDQSKTNSLPAKIIRVISNRKAVYGLKRAEDAGIPTLYHNLLKYKKQQPSTDEGIQVARSEYDAELARLVMADQPDLVVCAGFMHVFGESFLDPLAKSDIPVINLHPALPGQYNGTSAIERAHQDWKNGLVTKTGVMVHYVIKEVDMGEPILVRDIPFVSGADEDIEVFEQKLHTVEWEVLPQATAIAITEQQRKKATASHAATNGHASTD